MIFLNYQQLNASLKEVNLITSSEILTNDQIKEVKKLIKLEPSEEMGKGQCLFNAYQVAKISNAKIIEGVAYIQIEKDNSESVTFIKHAWNILNGKQFDITKDFVWPNLNASLKKIDYLRAEEFSKDEYELVDDAIDFKSEVDLIASSFKFLYTKNEVISTLNYFGLNKEFHEQLLNDCIISIKEK